MSATMSPTEPAIPHAMVASAESLQGHEVPWTVISDWLDSRGYALRPRHRSGWNPAWRDESKGENASVEELCALLPPGDLIDAIRKSTGELVYIQRVSDPTAVKVVRDLYEVLKKPLIERYPANHCAPLIDILTNPADPATSYVVTPYLHKADDPPLKTVKEVLSAVTQLLEGLVFMHGPNMRVAHRNIIEGTIRKDAAALFPGGFHPVLTDYKPDLKERVVEDPTARDSIKYYFFDWTHVFKSLGPYESTTRGYAKTLESIGVPEMLKAPESDYDPYKLDVYLLGTWFRREFVDCYTNVDFLVPLVEHMTRENVELRADAVAAQKAWKGIVNGLRPEVQASELIPVGN